MIRLESLILRTCECKALPERNLCVRILEMRAEAMPGLGRRCNACERTCIQLTLPKSSPLGLKKLLRLVWGK